MSADARVAQMMAEDRYGPMARIGIQVALGRTVAWAMRPRDGGDEVVAIAAAPEPGQAWSALLVVMLREAGPALTTQETAAVLGVSDGRVRQFVQSGRLTPTAAGAPGRQAALFSPAEVHRFMQLPRRRGMRELVEREDGDGSPTDAQLP